MPIMKEISEALNRAAEFFDEHGRPSEGSDFADLAAKIEQMRCETCAYWDSTPPSTCLYPASEMDNDGAFIEDCGPNFGCWHWKEEEVKNG